MSCRDCKHLLCTKMVVRGVMDCDQPEEYCELDLACEEDEECDRYEYYDSYLEYLQDQNDYDDYLIQKWECDNDR